MKFSVGFVVFVIFCLVVQEGQGQTDQTDQRLRHREKQRYRLAELSRASSSFGFFLYRQLISRGGQGPGQNQNIIFSPLSVFTALSMTLLGCDGPTKDQLRSVMAQRPRQGIHRTLRSIMDSFPASHSANVTLRMANALYYDDRQISLRDRFTNNVRRLYGASPMPFQRPQPERAINDWIYRATGGKIQDFLEPGQITPDMVLMLLNAVYFQGTWKDIFDESQTSEREFTTASGQVVRVPMMSRDGDYSVKVIERLAARVLELPFGTDDRFSLFILLPDQEDGLRDVEARLDSQVLENAMSTMPQASRYMISVPKFTLREKTSMKEMLQAMGLTRLFTSEADLARMSPSPLKVAEVQHEAVIEVDEKGATAAAVTSVGILLISLPPSFSVKHPFLLILRDKKARLNLFMGRVHDPSQAAA